MWRIIQQDEIKTIPEAEEIDKYRLKEDQGFMPRRAEKQLWKPLHRRDGGAAQENARMRRVCLLVAAWWKRKCHQGSGSYIQKQA